MPRFRFQWQHIPIHLREILAASAHLTGTEPEHFIKKFGKRPTLEFIRQEWPLLLDHWLTHDVLASARIALALRQHDLGDPAIADDIAYLHTCRNTQRLREIVLLEFITYGENPVDVSRVDSDSTAPVAHSSTPPTQQDPIEVLRHNLVQLLQKNFPTVSLSIHDDGDVSMTVGSSMLFLSIVPDPLLVRVYAVLLKNIPPTPELYETLNHVNHQLQIGRIFAIDNVVVLESAVLPFSLSEPVLLHTIAYIANVADEYDDRLQRSFGGDVWGITDAGDVIDV
ncbi:MAG: T3SS (YopN, CesT) and YbjN peptide-binding chaperone 1 [Roseiflexaceae bacterium]|jgi:hypothetical protein